MRFSEARIAGTYLIDLEPISDERGFNARAWCAREFAEVGLDAPPVQSNVIYNRHAGTLRGMHWQVPPFGESKLFRVVRGSLHDVVIDLRADSPTYGEWQSFTLLADVPRMLYVPELCAQGFQTLEDDTELVYQVSAPYSPDHGRGMRHDDPSFELDWPLPVSVISEKDASWPDFKLEVPAS